MMAPVPEPVKSVLRELNREGKASFYGMLDAGLGELLQALYVGRDCKEPPEQPLEEGTRVEVLPRAEDRDRRVWWGTVRGVANVRVMVDYDVETEPERPHYNRSGGGTSILTINGERLMLEDHCDDPRHKENGKQHERYVCPKCGAST